MIGIVIVSHSKLLAEGVQELAAQMVQGNVPIAVAAGVDDPANPLGTDAMQVYEAIASVYSDDGVLVLMDLGSALMSAEMALEFFSLEQQQQIHLCAAPLVEGAIAAAVTAASSSDIQQVIAAAQGALVAKATQLGLDNSHLSSVISEKPMTNDKEQMTPQIRLTIHNRFGLHARPAAQFVSCATRFQSQIRVRNITKNSDFVRADSINQVAMLGVRQGDEIAITATGVDADEALAALQALVTTNFGEDHITSPTPRRANSAVAHGFAKARLYISPTPSSFQGIPASPGVAIAPSLYYQKTPILWEQPTSREVQHYHVDNPESEWQRLHTALHTARQEIQTLLSHSSIQIGDTEAAIFDAHLLFLEDPTLLEASQERIHTQHLNAEAVWQGVINEVASSYYELDDPYLRERVADVVDVGQRVLRILSGTGITTIDVCQPAILVAADLTPSDTVSLDSTKILGICITAGSTTSHSAIIARSLGIPAIVGLPKEILQLADGTNLAIDGETGKVWIEAEPDILAALQAKRDAQHAAKQQAMTIAHQPCMTRDRHQISIFANVNCIDDTQQALNLGAEGVGLLRTEFLYLNRTTAPTEEQQLEVYQAIAEILADRPLIIRTLDVGGDKSIPYLDLGLETNPFLGWRGIRFCLDRPQVLKTQLRAILRASFHHQIKIMFPMIATVAEIRAAKTILAEVQEELRQAGVAFDADMKIGIMVEVPSAVAIAHKLATEVDFFSIGTNDLSQYIMAADRTNPKVANLADALHPAVLLMIQQTVEAGHAAGIWVGLCGEIAVDPLAAPILLGLGLDEVSLHPQAIPDFKNAIAQLTITQAQAIATAALQQDSAAKVRALVNHELR